MKAFQFIAALLAVFSTSTAIKIYCDPDSLNATMLECLTDNGVDQDLALVYLNPERLRHSSQELFLDQCNNTDKYGKAADCMLAEYNRCDDGSGMFPDMSQAMNMTKEMCNDPLLNIACMSSLTTSSALEKCITDNLKFDDPEWTKLSAEEIICESQSVGVQCTEYVGKKVCDAHTVSVMVKAAKLSTFKLCQKTDKSSPVIG